MSSEDEYLSNEVRAGMTRENLLRRAAALGLAATALGPLTEKALADTQAKRGGTFRLAVSGSSQDIIDAQHPLAKADTARSIIGWDRLASFDEKYRVRLELAEELRAEKADQYLVRIHDGVEFHNGKTLTVDDVIYSFRRIRKLKLTGNGGLSAIDLNRFKKLDKRTMRVFLTRPDVTLNEAFAQFVNGIVPVGYAPKSFRKGPLHAIGTGPFKLKSFTPGRQSVHVRNENYWRNGRPYFDEVVILTFTNDQAKLNALLSGQVDAMTDVPYAQVPVVGRRGNLKVLISQTAAWNPFTMAIDQEPFTDVRVRRAFRLLANRPQMVAQGLSGFGRVGNDIFSPFDPAYSGDELPQHQYDPEKAKSFLKAAGKENLPIELVTSPAETGMIEAATIFTENAKAGGVNVSLKKVDPGTAFGDQYTHWTFAQDYWGTRNYLQQAALIVLASSSFNTTHWDKYENYARYQSLYNQAVRTVDVKKRAQVIRQMQRMDYDDGGLIVWGFKNLTDAYSRKVGGFKPDRGTLNLNKYGNWYRDIYFV
jgi:peptide/nickel transport system substrate-binding protein